MSGENHPSLSSVHTMKRPAGRDSEIVLAAQAGSPEAFSELYALYSRRLYRTIIAITRNAADTEDVLQETFLRGYIALHTFEGRASFYSWLTQIAINTALMVLRKRRIRAEILFDPQPDDLAEAVCFEFKDQAPNPEQVCDSSQRRVNLQHAIQNLSPHLREPIEMKLANDSSMKEIGRALDISVAAVKTRLHRARARLSASLSCNIPQHSTVFRRHLSVARGSAQTFTAAGTSQIRK
jgi:RNA polymerase sigma-70 factor (ECF subfamily)